MSSSPLDRQLLFAILAFQNAFISREQFLAAANSWMLDKSVPFDQIFVDRGILTRDEFELLSALVARHVAIHGHDPQRSLAALSSVGSLKEDLDHLADEDLKASIEHVVFARAATDRYATQQVTISQRTSGNLRFRILRPHAKGGLGQVYVAFDEELNREVALKEIQSRRADDVLVRQRFLLEAEVTGALEHPCIVPVYGLGQYVDGRPFYAMKFIRGDSLSDVITTFHRRDKLPTRSGGWTDNTERTLQIRDLLSRFVDVCNAIHYAHNRGVLHRDIKPENIMVGTHGETLVVDWGLAKSIDDRVAGNSVATSMVKPRSGGSASATQEGSALGTPSYMSPEQARGRMDEVGVTSDVFSLGATLYCLMTGSPPYTGDNVAEILRKAGKGEFIPPGNLSPQAPRPLQAICLKAVSFHPSSRYQTARSLADDVERFLADEPVAAYEESASERLARWMRKNTNRVYAVLGSMLLLSVVVISLVSIRAARQRAQDAMEVATALDQFLTADLATALSNASPAGEGRSFEGALTEASQRFIATVPNHPSLRLRMHITFGDFLLNTGELSGAERQFQLAQALGLQFHAPPDLNRKAQIGTAIARWRRGDPGALGIIERIRDEMPPDDPPQLLRWIDLEFAKALKNTTREYKMPDRLKAIDQATEIFARYVPMDDAPPDSVSLTMAEMAVERANALQGEEKASQLRAALEMFRPLVQRVSAIDNKALNCETWSEYAKLLHRLGRMEEADDAYFRACTQLCEVLGTQHWRTTETVYSWMVLLNQSLPRADVADPKIRWDRGGRFFLKHFLRTNQDDISKLEQNAVGAISRLLEADERSEERLAAWMRLDREVRDVLLTLRQKSGNAL